MPRKQALLGIAALTGTMLLAASPSYAAYGGDRAPYGQGRYCAVVNNGTGSVREICDFNSFEACRLEVVSGNRGFCRNNSYFAEGPQQWGGQLAAPGRHSHRKHRRL
jgi:hypothetical protein